jgi:type IV pilus assembly protein PilE
MKTQLLKMKWINYKGFTLIEFLVVMVIAGVISAIAVPIYSDYVKDGETQEAYSALNYWGNIAASALVRAHSNGNNAIYPDPPGAGDFFTYSKSAQDTLEAKNSENKTLTIKVTIDGSGKVSKALGGTLHY